MKILILSDDFPPKSFGGAGIIAFEQAKEFVKRGHQVSVITTVQEKNLAQRISQDGFDIYQIYSKYPERWRAYVSLYNPQTVSSIKNILKELKPDVIHAHNIHQHISYKSLDYAHKNAKAVFMTMHDAMSVHYSKIYPKLINLNDGEIKFDYKVSNLYQALYFWRQWNPFRNIIIRHYLKNVDRIFSVSQSLSDALIQNGVKISSVLYNGISQSEFVVSEKEIELFKNKHDLTNKKVLFFGGRLGRAKGGDVALRLLIELHKRFKDVVLMVAGKDDSYIKVLKKKISSAGLENNFKFISWLDRGEMFVAYGASDIVLTLSLYLDPFPTVNLEALASGKPVIGTVYGGTPELVQDNKTGYIVNPNDFESVVYKTSKLLEDNVLAKRFGESGKERVSNLFSLIEQIDKLEKIYEQYK
jgi:glycosyltransferase involved in cell wall biosynthesis